MSLISLKSDKVDFFLRNPARLNFEGRNVKEDVDENRKNFGYLILDPNRTPIQMCLALARKSRKTGHSNRALVNTVNNKHALEITRAVGLVLMTRSRRYERLLEGLDLVACPLLLYQSKW